MFRGRLAVDASRVAELRVAADLKSDSEPLSPPWKKKSEALKSKMRKGALPLLINLVALIAAASSSGFNPLAFASETTEGAFVASNVNELQVTPRSYLFITTLAHLRRGAPPPLAEYTRLPHRRDPHTTPMRWALEMQFMLDPATKEICEMWALLAALCVYFDFKLTRKQMRKIFLYNTVKQEGLPLGLVHIDFPELLRVLKAQNVRGLNQHSTVKQMCDLLIAPFIHLFWTNREQHRDAVCAILHITKVEYKARLAPMKKAKKAKKGKGKKAAVAKKEKVTTTRKQLVARQNEEAKAKKQQAVAEAAAAAPPSRSGKRKAAGAQAKAPKKAKTVAATVEPNPCASIGLSAPVLAPRQRKSKAGVDDIDALLHSMHEDSEAEERATERAKEREIFRMYIAEERAKAAQARAFVNNLQRAAEEAYEEDDAVAFAPGLNDNSDIFELLGSGS